MNIEQFVNDYLQEHRLDMLLNPYNGLVDFANAFKEQMMKGSVDFTLEFTHQITLPRHGPGFGNIGDKVRVIVLPKEDSHE